MNKVMQLPKARGLKANATLYDYLKISQERFNKLEKIFEGNWGDASWKYTITGENLNFNIDGLVWSEEIENSAKIFLIKYIWDKRLKGSLPSHTALRSLLLGPRLLASIGIKRISEINQETYLQAHQSLVKYNSIATQIGYINSLNNQISWLENEYMLSSTIDLIKAPKINQIVPIDSKMPDRELIQIIISAKWAIEEFEDHTARWESDLLAIYSQAFQYGMGLRIGEALRLPENPIIWKDDEMFFLVWTEKGSKPIARYVPETWREAFQHSIDSIKKATEPYRKRAKELETRGRLTEVENRFNDYHQNKHNDVITIKQQLDSFLTDKSSEAKAKWILRDTIISNNDYSLKDIQALMPELVTPSSKTNAQILKSFEKWGLRFTATPISKTQKKYHIKGQKILYFIDTQVDFRHNHVTDSELLLLLHGRELHREQSQDPLIVERRIFRGGGIAIAYTMKGIDKFDGGRRPPSTISRPHALEIIEHYAGGGFDTTKYIDFKSFQNLFPDLFTAGLATTLSKYEDLPKELRNTDKVRFYAKASGNSEVYRYKPVSGYLLEQESVHEYIKNEFYRLNSTVEKEIYEQNKQELADIEKEEGLPPKETEINSVIISSSSFKVKQKISDFLFLRAAHANLQLIPEIMGYKAITFSFKGNDRFPSLFERYGVSDDKDLIAKYQSHKGRHWQTTSLFKSGASSEVTNAWMGRTTQQGAHYDHNTDIERAKQVQKAILEDTQRIIGPVAEKVKEFRENQISLELIEDFLEQQMHTIQHTPLGMCSRPMFLKPCDLNMRCLTGNNGKGCKHYALDIGDVSQIAKLQVYRDKTGRELERLAQKLEEGHAAAEMHIESQSTAFNNVNLILRGADAILEKDPNNDGEYLPFKKEGSYPDDCPFQCGDNK